MGTEFNLRAESARLKAAATKEWEAKLQETLKGKTITFYGNAWEDPNGDWRTHTQKVRNCLPNRTGNPFYSEVEFISEEGKYFSIHPDYDIKFN